MLAVAVAAWLGTGVGTGDIVLFAAHECGFVLAPGCLLYVALSRGRRSRLEVAAVGYALGSVFEVLAFALTAAVHARWALWAYPPVAIAAAGVLARHRSPTYRDGGGEPTGSDRRSAWALAGVCSVAILFLVVAYFLFEPLPQRVTSVVYIADLVFHLGVAAEALHHWPISDPKVAGIALPYETFIYMKLAAASQLTHVALPTLLFRLYVLPLIVTVAGLLTTVGAIVSHRRSVGVTAAALFLFVGQLGLDSHDLFVFYNTIFFSLFDSPTFLFGLVVFLALLVVLIRLLRDGGDLREHVLLVVLLIGCAGAKASILPVLIGGLALYVLWQRVRGAPARPGWIALSLTGAVFVLTYIVIYHGGTGGLALHPPGSVREMSIIRYAESRLGGSIGGPLFWVFATVIGVVGFCGATLVGIPAALSSRRLRLARSTELLLALLIASLVPFLLFTHKGGSQNFFAYYGVCAATVLSAQGLVLMLDRARSRFAGRERLVALSALSWLALLLAASVLPYALVKQPRIGPLYAIWITLPALAVIALWIVGLRTRTRMRVCQLLAAAAVLGAGLLDTPLHTGAALVPPLRAGSSLYRQDSAALRGLTTGLEQALAWIRGHTPTSAVIAVNNQYSDPQRTSPDYYYYSAFGERRVFLEGWVDTIPAASFTNPALTPFPRRFWINSAVFGSADPRALAAMRAGYGVRYLLVDRAHGPVNSRLRALGTIVFQNRSAIVYKVG